MQAVEDEISAKNMLHIINKCKTVPTAPMELPIVFKELWSWVYIYSRSWNFSRLTDAEYDCICDLFLIPRRVRFSTEQVADRYTDRLMNDVEGLRRYTKHSFKVWEYLYNLRDGKWKPNAYDTPLDIMENIVYRRIVQKLSYKEAIYQSLAELSERGVEQLPIMFLNDFFNSYVMLNPGTGAKLLTANQVVQQNMQKCIRCGERVIVNRNVRYAVVFKGKSKPLHIFGCLGMEDYAIYNPWIM